MGDVLVLCLPRFRQLVPGGARHRDAFSVLLDEDLVFDQRHGLAEEVRTYVLQACSAPVCFTTHRGAQVQKHSTEATIVHYTACVRGQENWWLEPAL